MQQIDCNPQFGLRESISPLRVNLFLLEFRNLMRERRCLIPADWFYEWKATAAGKDPYLVRMASREPFLIGGLWDTWHYGREDALATFTVLTCVPNELTGTLHDRMPLILAASDHDRWLDCRPGSAEPIIDLLEPPRAGQLETIAVNPKLNDPRSEGPDMIAPAQLTLR